MGPVRLQEIVSFSSQDVKNPVENLLQNLLGKGWLSSPDDKTGFLEAVFQLEKAALIQFVDIGNCGCSHIEIMVGCSSWPRNRPYATLLPATCMMSTTESKRGQNRISVRMFTIDDLNPEAVKLKWDRIKVVCSQPFRRDMQFGITFLRLSNKETEPEPLTKTPSSEVNTSVRKSFSDRFYRNGAHLKSFSMNNIKGFENTSRRPSKELMNKTSIGLGVEKNQNPEDDSGLETDILLFLTSNENGHCSESCEDCLKQYEETRNISLSLQGIQKFQQVFQNVYQGEPLTNSVCSPSSKFKRKRIRADRQQDENNFFFDLNFEPKLSNGLCGDMPVQNGHIDEDYDSDSLPIVDIGTPVKKAKFSNIRRSGPLPLITIEDDAEQGSSSNHRLSSPNSPEDFVQFDGSKPGSSKDVTYVDCPICSEPFHVEEIERHAATCEKYNSDDSEDNDKDRRESSRKHYGNAISPKRGHSYSEFLACPVCGITFHKTALPSHASNCMEIT